ncbi:MAG: hypothetical protein WEB03_03175 [Nitriliruptor sp.]
MSVRVEVGFTAAIPSTNRLRSGEAWSARPGRGVGQAGRRVVVEPRDRGDATGRVGALAAAHEVVGPVEVAGDAVEVVAGAGDQRGDVVGGVDVTSRRGDAAGVRVEDQGLDAGTVAQVLEGGEPPEQLVTFPGAGQAPVPAGVAPARRQRIGVEGCELGFDAADLGVEQHPVGVVADEARCTVEATHELRITTGERQRRRTVERREDGRDASRVSGLEVEQELTVADSVRAAARYACGVKLVEQVQRQAAEQPRTAIERRHRVGEGRDVPVEDGEPTGQRAEPIVRGVDGACERGSRQTRVSTSDRRP